MALKQRSTDGAPSASRDSSPGGPHSVFEWRTLVLAAAGASVLLYAASAVALGDKEPLLFVGLLLVGLWLLHRGHRVWSTVVLGFVFADTAFWMLSGAVSAIGYHERAVDLFLPASLSAVSVAGLIAILGFAFGGRADATHGSPALWVGAAVVALLVLTLAAESVLYDGAGMAPRAGDLVLRADNTAFSRQKLVTEPGAQRLLLSNGDLFWHTFTIDALDVDLRVPVNGTRQIRFSARPGVYSFYCRIPGHELAGMRGTLVVR